MAIHILCPHCRSPFVLGDELAGQVFTCTNCEGLIQLPVAPPAALPPIEMIETYRHVVGNQPPLILEVLGIFTDWGREGHSGVGDGLRFAWSLRHVVLLILIIIYTYSYTDSPGRAENAAPWFLGVTLLCIVWGYLDAVWIASQQEKEENASPQTGVTTWIVDPFALVCSDYRDALPAYRAWALGLCLGFSCLCVGNRAGSLNTLIPSGVRQVLHIVTSRPENTKVIIDNSSPAPANGDTLGQPGGTPPPPPPETRPVYHSENGPPPPPPDQ